MPMDFARTRVDVGNVEHAVDATPVQQNIASITDIMSRAIGRGAEQLGSGIGGGLAQGGHEFAAGYRENHPQGVRKQQQDAASTDLAQRAAADRGRQGSQLTTTRQLAQESMASQGQTLPPDSQIIKGGVEEVFGPGGYDQMTPTQRQAVAGLYTSVVDEKPRRVLPGGEEQAKTMGRYYNPEFHGEGGSDVLRQAHAEFMGGLRDLASKSPLFAPQVLEKNERDIAAARATDAGSPEVAEVIRNHGTPTNRELATSILPYYRSGEVHPFVMKNGSTKLMTVGDFVRGGDFDIETVNRNIGSTRTAWPLIGVNDKGKPEDQMTDEALRSLGDSEKKVMRHYVGSDVMSANQALVGFRTASAILQKVKGSSWLPKNDGKADGPYARARQAQTQISQAISRGDVTEDQAALSIASMMGWVDVPDSTLQKDGLIGGSGDSRFRESLASAKVQAPELARLLDGEEAQATFLEQYKRSIKSNVQYESKGPLGFLHGADPGMVSTVLGDFASAANSDPMLQAFTNHVQALGGLGPRDAEQMSRELYSTFQRGVSYAKTAYVSPDGKRFDQMNPTDQYSVLLGIGHDVIKPALASRKVATGADSRAISGAILGRPPVSAVEAQQEVDGHLKENPQVGLGQGVIDLNDKSRITFDRGRARGVQYKNAQGEWQSSPFADRAMESADAATRVALVRRMYADDVKSKNPMDLASSAAAFKLGGTGNALADGLFSEKVNGVSIYDWVKSSMDSKADPPAAFGAALDRAVSDYAARGGRNVFDLREQLGAASSQSDDPIVDTVARYVEQMTSPDKDTVGDLKAIEGDDMSEIARMIGKEDWKSQEMGWIGGQGQTLGEGAGGKTGAAQSRPAKSQSDPLADMFDQAQQASAAVGPVSAGLRGWDNPEEGWLASHGMDYPPGHPMRDTYNKVSADEQAARGSRARVRSGHGGSTQDLSSDDALRSRLNDKLHDSGPLKR